ncbi:hypothetical protein A2690_03575 [Candidatus Roizmanbacteria bacterium RIFCSPHIGHO2_01_FULL_39_12b]|uniref:DUF5660 domain-containing protein n=1 Tax=Candidatus Roizmanbacteria bacterium RIFCSPHIGHO2_01_FULL_39_12b TaxID=1802030 RepID=A0A1F7GD65_9BACT|nr:MAG: hypothetical protein A2690_03575 [Candidatus Roizmanbacteria bacterium RIFCSPHIGHO2_01_FULL_39_12b]
MFSTNSKKPLGNKFKNPYETQANPADKIPEALKRAQETQQSPQKRESVATGNFRREFTIFKQSEHYETKIVPQQLTELMNQLKIEISEIKKRNEAMIAEVSRIENQTLQSLPEKAGIYHVRFAELLLEMLRGLRSKMSEANTWMMAMMSKKKKRGSAFLTHSKKKGTQYMLSQELQTARNVM